MLGKSSEPLLKHLTSVTSLSEDIVRALFKRADYFKTTMEKDATTTRLQGKIVANLFFEPSTRTLNSFEIAAQRLGALILSPNLQFSSTVKGESLIDTIHTFEALGTSIFVIRHTNNNTAEFVASELLTSAHVINGGDGTNEHPTQALLDLYTIHQHKKFKGLSVAIIGDIAHSRVARSLIIGLRVMGCTDIRIIAPKVLVPDDADDLEIQVADSFQDGLADVDVVCALRIQKERIEEAKIPDASKFFDKYGLTQQRLELAKPDAIVMHPAPINRGIEIESSVADGPQSVILDQMSNGVAMRMAIMDAMYS